MSISRSTRYGAAWFLLTDSAWGQRDRRSARLSSNQRGALGRADGRDVRSIRNSTESVFPCGYQWRGSLDGASLRTDGLPHSVRETHGPSKHGLANPPERPTHHRGHLAESRGSPRASGAPRRRSTYAVENSPNRPSSHGATRVRRT